MPAYMMLALDMDGTPLTSDKRISVRTADALRHAADAGVTVVFSTGRALSEVEDYRVELDGIVRYGVLLSGGVVRDYRAGETLSVELLPAEMVRIVVAQGLSEDAMVQLFTTECAVMTHRDVARMPQIGQGIFQDLALRRGHLVESIAEYVEEHVGDICKINLHHVDRTSLATTRAALAHLPLQLYAGESATVEVTPLGVTKARGLRLACEHLGIRTDEMVVVGDSENDLEALGLAGLAVAMGNASPEVRESADIVVADNDHDGIAEVVERWL